MGWLLRRGLRRRVTGEILRFLRVLLLLVARPIGKGRRHCSPLLVDTGIPF